MSAPRRGRHEPRPVIVKKVTVVAASHHGGAWKVAYADFVTAMMAFFLLLWLLGSTSENQRKGIADYFTPTLVKLKEESAGSNGLLGGTAIAQPDNYPNRPGQTGSKAITIPRDATGGPREGADRKLQIDRLQRTLDAKMKANAQLQSLARQLRLVDTVEGIRIDLVDSANFSMFQLGTTVLTPQATALLKVIADTVRPGTEGVSVRGHTDALPWRSGVPANNWSLSAGRAEATRQALMRSGIGETRFRRIEGVADRELLVKDNPQDPRNRRISILLMG
jgi:chemotaxis protein MotB